MEMIKKMLAGLDLLLAMDFAWSNGNFRNLSTEDFLALVLTKYLAQKFLCYRP